jgi:molybdopterin-guanine dinucleotide biosynthesis protein A
MENSRQITAIILAGGGNSRIGRNKALLQIEGVTFIDYILKQIKDLCDDIIISSNNPSLYKHLPYKKVQDIIKEQGPLMGIYSCLLESVSDINFVLACDVPKINLNLLRKLLSFSMEYDVVVPVLPNGKYEPLYAVYNKAAIPAMREILDSDRRKTSLIFDKVNVKFVYVEDLNWCFNINTEEDYKKLISTMEG